MKTIAFLLLLSGTALGQGLFYAGSDPHVAHAVLSHNLSLVPDKQKPVEHITFKNFHTVPPVKYSMCKAAQPRTFSSAKDETKKFEAVVLGVDSKKLRVRMERKGKKPFFTSWKHFSEADQTWLMAYSVSQVKRINYEKRVIQQKRKQ